jgi:hypothetical protein
MYFALPVLQENAALGVALGLEAYNGNPAGVTNVGLAIGLVHLQRLDFQVTANFVDVPGS